MFLKKVKPCLIYLFIQVFGLTIPYWGLNSRPSNHALFFACVTIVLFSVLVYGSDSVPRSKIKQVARVLVIINSIFWFVFGMLDTDTIKALKAFEVAIIVFLASALFYSVRARMRGEGNARE